MAKTSEKINVTELDFDAIKDNIKTYLQSQSQFSDYDFEGSGLNILLDVLALNTHYTSWIGNMNANEMFIDSAVLRESIVSHAKMLNFDSRSAVSPTAKLSIVFTPSGSPSSLTINKDTKFTTVVDGVTYTFTTPSSTQIIPASGVYSVTDVEIKEGEFLDFQWTVDTSNTSQRFVIPNTNIDTSILTVTVQNSITDSTTTVYKLASDLNLIKATDAIYWLHEVEDEKFELEFGDGNVGKKLIDGNIVRINYLVTSGPASNKAFSFTPVATVAGETSDNFTITVTDVASGGSLIQSADEIKYLAPKLYQSQGRAITELDYENIVKNLRSDIQSVKVWGGENAFPAKFGQVFLALKPNNAEIYSDNIKNQIVSDILESRNVVTITPVILDPDFTYIKITTTVNYDPILLTGTTSTLQTSIETVIKNYFTNTLSRFDASFRHSVLSTLIDEVDESLRNNATDLVLQKRFEPTAQNQTFTLSFNNQVEVNSVVSEQFTFGSTSNAWLRDDGAGIIEVVHQTGTTTPVLSKPGTIDYTTGKIVISDFAATPNASNGVLNIDLTPTKRDIVSVREQLLTRDDDDSTSLSVSLVSEPTI